MKVERKIITLLLGSLPLLLLSCGGGKQDERSDTGKAEGESKNSGGNNAGRELYVKNCGSCHQSDGSGVPGMYPPLRGTETVQDDKEQLIRTVLEGKDGKIEVKGRSYDQQMPAQDHLTDKEVARILSYVRKEFGKGASKVAPEEVKKLRGASGEKEGKK